PAVPRPARRDRQGLRRGRPGPPPVLGEPQLAPLPVRRRRTDGLRRRAARGRVRHLRVRVLLQLPAIPRRHRGRPPAGPPRTPQPPAARPPVVCAACSTHLVLSAPGPQAPRVAIAALPPVVQQDAWLVFTAQSVPAAMAAASGRAGGLYPAQLAEAARLVAGQLAAEEGHERSWRAAFPDARRASAQPLP